MRGKRWTFTLNNYTLPECELIQTPQDSIGYLIVGREVGEEGTPHLQGYVEFSSKRTLQSAKNILGSQRLHMQLSRGTMQQNKDYCSKDGDILCEYGEPMRQGQRNDLNAVIEMIQDGDSIPEIWRTFPSQMIRYERGIRSAYQQLSPNVQVAPPNFALNAFGWDTNFDWGRTHILWGDAGIGKTEFARALLPTALFVTHLDDLGNFDASLHEGIIFDDMDFKHLPRTSQIHLVDQSMPRSIHCRYRTATIPPNTKKIFLTNESGGNIFLLTDAAIRRRIHITELLINLR